MPRKPGTRALTPSRMKLSDEQSNSRLEEMRVLIAGQISLGSGLDGEWSGHIDGQHVKVVIPESASPFLWPHGLGREPIGFFLYDQSAAGDLRRSGSYDLNNLSLISSGAIGDEYKILVF